MHLEVEAMNPHAKRHYVLDLGCHSGSAECDAPGSVVVRVDLERQEQIPGTHFVQADAARLPFRTHTFKSVTCNHSLEHFEELEDSLDEIGRITKSGASLLVSVPDCRTITDRVYRWLARGGGHVNGFGSAGKVAELIEAHTGLRHVAGKTLCSSLSFMNHRNVHTAMPRRMALFLWGAEPFLVLLNAATRVVDRITRTRASVYGWAFWFGTCARPPDGATWINVCVRCGRGHSSDWLKRVQASFSFCRLVPLYRCPSCEAVNIYFRDEDFASLQ